MNVSFKWLCFDSAALMIGISLFLPVFAHGQSPKNDLEIAPPPVTQSQKADIDVDFDYLPKMNNRKSLPSEETSWEISQLFKEGRLLHRKGEFKRAAEFYFKAYQLDSNRIEILSYLGLALDCYGFYPQALIAYDRYLSQEPGHLVTAFNRTVTLYHLGRLNEALDSVNDLALKLPDSAKLYNLRGVIYQSLGKYELAGQDFDRAISIEPTDSLAPKLNKATLFMDLDQFAISRAYFQDIVRDYPRSASAHNNYGVLLSKSDKDMAQQQYDIAYSMGLATSRLNSVTLNINFGEIPDLLEAADLADKFSEYPQAQLIYAVTLYKNGRYADALAELKNLTSRVDTPFAQEYMGMCLFMLGDYNQALPNLRKACLDAPKSVYYLHNLSLALNKVGKSDEALEKALEAYKLSPMQFALCYHTALLYDMKADFNSALKYYKECRQLTQDKETLQSLTEHISELEEQVNKPAPLAGRTTKNKT